MDASQAIVSFKFNYLSRYLKLLKKKCSKLFFCVNKKIKPFFEKLNIVDKVYLNEDKIEHYDFRIDLMSLPYLFNTDKSNVPDVNFIIRADKDKLVQWQNKLIHPPEVNWRLPA